MIQLVMFKETVIAKSDRIPSSAPLGLEASGESTASQDELMDAVVVLCRKPGSKREANCGEPRLTQGTDPLAPR